MAFKTLLKGLNGEQNIRKVLKSLLDGEVYHAYNNVLIGSSPRSTQIDHIIVSKYGIFVIETKNIDGCIFGSSYNKQWTQVFHGGKYPFQNPLRQNYKHTQKLAEFLGIPHNKMHSLVVFGDKCQFKTQMPLNVVKSTGIVNSIKSKKRIFLTDDEVARVNDKLLMLQYNTPFLNGRKHASKLNKRYDSTMTCPKCGGNLKKRTARTGKRAGQEFLGCEKYPQCRYTKEL